MTHSSFNYQLASWRERQGYTQEAAARAIGIPLGTIRNWEQARSTPSDFAQGLILARLRHLNRDKHRQRKKAPRKATK